MTALIKGIDPAVLGNAIREARQRARLSQTAAAEGIVSTGYLSRIEAGARQPTEEVLGQIAQRLGTTPERLVVAATVDSDLVAGQVADATLAWLDDASSPQAYAALIEAAARWRVTRNGSLVEPQPRPVEPVVVVEITTPDGRAFRANVGVDRAAH